MLKYILVSVIIFSFTSCKKEKPTPKVRYESSASKSATALDTTQIAIAELPVNFDGTNFLVYPIGEFYSNSTAKTSLDRSSFTISNYNEYEITGYLSNLKFQQKDSDSLKMLTDKMVMIERATYLKTLYDRTKKSLMVYVLTDMDSNKDGKMDTNDIKSLYISDSNGFGFKKLTSDLQELIDWTLIDYQNRIYFRTIEDINKNGAFDKNDKMHYYFLELLSEDIKASEYFPV